IIFESLADRAVEERHEQIRDHYEARLRQAGVRTGDAIPYRPVDPERMYLSPAEIGEQAAGRLRVDLTPFDVPATEARAIVQAGAVRGRNFAEERADPKQNVFDHAV